MAVRLEEAADLLGVSSMSIYRYMASGKLSGKKYGQTWDIDPQSVTDAWRQEVAETEKRLAYLKAAGERWGMKA